MLFNNQNKFISNRYHFNHLSISVTTVMIVQGPYTRIGRITEEDLRDSQESAIMSTSSFPNCILSSCKANMAAIATFIIQLVSSKVNFLHQMQTNQTAHSVAIRLSKHILASVRMLTATATMIIGKEANQHNPQHLFSVLCVVCCGLCVQKCVVFAVNWHNSTTSQSYAELHISACCS